MPLLDHFHPPLYPCYQWKSFHSNWATRIADGIMAMLPSEFQVEEHTRSRPGCEMDIAAGGVSQLRLLGSVFSSFFRPRLLTPHLGLLKAREHPGVGRVPNAA